MSELSYSYFRFFALQRKYKKIALDEVQKFYIRSYSPLKEFGGYGIRTNKGGTAYNVSGKKGLQLELKGGKKFLIGTQKPELLLMAIQSATGRSS